MIQVLGSVSRTCPTPRRMFRATETRA
jgi:hypothetical protein